MYIFASAVGLLCNIYWGWRTLVLAWLQESSNICRMISDSTHVRQVPFVPKQWRPTDPTVRQIPDTFPVRTSGAAKKAPPKEDGRKKRHRKLLPSAWAHGKFITWLPVLPWLVGFSASIAFDLGRQFLGIMCAMADPLSSVKRLYE